MEELFKKYPAIGLGAFALIAFVVAYFFGNKTGKAATPTDTELKEAQKSTPLTYELSQYATLADRLETAMYGATDDEDAVYSVFSKLRNRADLLQLISSFGKRRIFLTIGDSNLSTWIYHRLNKSEVEKVNEILSRNAIDYQF